MVVVIIFSWGEKIKDTLEKGENLKEVHKDKNFKLFTKENSRKTLPKYPNKDI